MQDPPPYAQPLKPSRLVVAPGSFQPAKRGRSVLNALGKSGRSSWRQAPSATGVSASGMPYHEQVQSSIAAAHSPRPRPAVSASHQLAPSRLRPSQATKIDVPATGLAQPPVNKPLPTIHGPQQACVSSVRRTAWLIMEVASVWCVGRPSDLAMPLEQDTARHRQRQIHLEEMHPAGPTMIHIPVSISVGRRRHCARPMTATRRTGETRRRVWWAAASPRPISPGRLRPAAAITNAAVLRAHSTRWSFQSGLSLMLSVQQPCMLQG